MYYNIIIASIVLILSSNTFIYSIPCGTPTQCLSSNTSDDANCGVSLSQRICYENTVEYNLSFPARSRLTISLVGTCWLTGISVSNSATSNISSFSFAYSRTDVDLSPVQLATLYNSSLTAGALVHLERGASRRFKFQIPVQAQAFVIFGYGSFSAEGSITAQLFGCPLSDLSFPITASNLLQYSYPEPESSNCTSTSDQVENGIVYGMDGILVDGSTSSFLTWNASDHNSLLPLTFSFYRATSIQTIRLFYMFNTNPIKNVTIYSPGNVPCTRSELSMAPATINFTSPLITDYIQLDIELENELTLTEVTMHDSEGNNLLTSPVHITLPTRSEPYLTALIATSSSLSCLLLLSLLAISVLLLVLFRSQRNLSVLIRFYDTLTPDRLAVYSSIKRTPKSRDYVNMMRFFNDMVTSQGTTPPKSSQPLPSRPGTRAKCVSETSSIALGDYERVGPVLAEHESIKNSSSGRAGLAHALSNSLTFFNRSKCGVRTNSNNLDEVIIYDSPPQSPDVPRSGPPTTALSVDRPSADSRYSVHTASYLEPNEVKKEDFKSPESENMPLSVSNHQLYNLARSPLSPTQPQATFHFVEDTDLSRSTAKRLAGITLSQLDASISSDSV